MNIRITNILDSKIQDTSGLGSRLLLADQIIEQFTPLFSDEIERSKKQLDNNKADISKLKKDVTKCKKDLNFINEAVKKENIKNQILTEMNYLFDYGVLYGQNKQTVKNILSKMDAQSSSGLEENLKLLKGLVRRNIKKIMR